MVALPAVPKVVRIDHHYSQAHTANLQIREFFQYSGSLSTADATTWLTAIVAAHVANISPLQVSSCTLTGSELTDLTSTTSPQILNGTTQVGGNANPPLPAGTALIVRKQIVRRYRGGHPRVYLPAHNQTGLLNPTSWTSSYLATYVAAYQAYIAACIAGLPAAGGTGTHVNISYYHGFTTYTPPSGRTRVVPTPRATPLIDAIVNSVGVSTPGTQRRRNETP